MGRWERGERWGETGRERGEVTRRGVSERKWGEEGTSCSSERGSLPLSNSTKETIAN